MAEARMLSRSVGTDERLNALSHEAMLLYLMAIPHLDRDGLIDGRPRILWAMAAPLQDGMMARAGGLIDEWVEAGLVVRYDDNRRPVLFFPGFARNQPRMVYQRERESRFACPPGYVRTPAGLVRLADEGAAHDEVTLDARALRAETNGDAPAARDQVATNSRPRRAEDQDQDQTEVQGEDQVGEGGRTCIITTPAAEHRAPAQPCAPRRPPHPHSHRSTGYGSVGRTSNSQVSAGEILHTFTEEQLRMACYQLGSTLGLHHEWHGYEQWLARQPTTLLLGLLEWIAFYRGMPPASRERIESLTAVIRSRLRSGNRAPLNGSTRRQLAVEIEAAVNAWDGA